MALFLSLHACGITVVLVTHDPQIAAHAERVVRFADGRIEDDSRARSVA
jgi:predicted ABC-type transport system involved in lysophospholipase L1 biosynthesis ATPase subunit